MRRVIGTLAASAVGVMLALHASAATSPPAVAGPLGETPPARESFDLLQAKAHHGVPESEYQLGLRYDLGQDVPQDRRTAFQWYKRAADAGIAAAEMNVAVMLDNGLGVSQDEAAAAVWYAKAAAHGNRRAAFDLGQLYQSGEGVPRNPAVAAAWYADAAKGGLTAAAAQLKQLRVPARGTPAGGQVRLQPATLAAPRTNGVVPDSARAAPVELVWTAPAEPVPVSFAVQVWSVGHAGITRVFRAQLERTAVVIPLAPMPGLYAWRVDVQAQDGRHFAPGQLSWFTTAPPSGMPPGPGLALAQSPRRPPDRRPADYPPAGASIATGRLWSSASNRASETVSAARSIQSPSCRCPRAAGRR